MVVAESIKDFLKRLSPESQMIRSLKNALFKVHFFFMSVPEIVPQIFARFHFSAGRKPFLNEVPFLAHLLEKELYGSAGCFTRTERLTATHT